ncbi:hypothetical protein Pmar_PMAR027530 [Perkinsus marinus ATCC 50983]|uniref:Uncharacterized protein n=1 Tax=Perkinsus marinus (strain ATCC 50983 / TXsc) TaxID=423536 RepID=C5LPD9_PERM5|nr:hypothetical protein Pmar_PMAR027530 [Perkinsus marinus ATCC 50983]EER01401.1 hypothetical protein Pmar_PMAR027530 [Perkinsus marinus ATCC 50983]|eukprot:XP_002768683.1 hypothetical protein Pmar_PMAR027530 [Perkinsus marinus ATCC 50983]
MSYARKSLSFGTETGEVDRRSSSSVQYNTLAQQQHAAPSTTTTTTTTTVGLLFDEEGGAVTTPIPTTTTVASVGLLFDEEGGAVTTPISTTTTTRAPVRNSMVLSFGSEEGTKEESSSQSEHESIEVDTSSTSSEEVAQAVVLADNSTTGVNRPACHSSPKSVRVYNSETGAPISMNTEDPLAPYKLDILLSTLYVGPAPTDLLLTAITKDGNIVEFRFSDRRALKCFLVYLFEKKTLGEDKQDRGIAEEEGDGDIEEIPINSNSTAVKAEFSEEEAGVVEENQLVFGEPRPTPASTTSGLLEFGEDDGHVGPRSEPGDDGSRMLSFGVEEGEAEKVIEEESSHIPTPSTARALENTTTTTTTTTEPGARLVTFAEHKGEVTTTAAPTNSLAFDSEEGTAEEVAESSQMEERSRPIKEPNRLLQFQEEDGEAVKKEEAVVEVGGDSGKGSGHSERLGGDSEVAESGETIKRPGSTSTTTPAPTEPASSPASLNFDMREGETPTNTGRGLLAFGVEEGEAEHVAESVSTNTAITTTTRAPSSSTSTAPLTPEPTTAPLLFGNEEGEAERVAASESVFLWIADHGFGLERTVGKWTLTMVSGVTLGGDTRVTQGRSRIEEGGQEFREDRRTSSNTTNSRSRRPESKPGECGGDAGTMFEEDVGEVKSHEPTEVVDTKEEIGEVARPPTPRPLNFREHDGVVEAKPGDDGPLSFGGDGGSLRNVLLGGDTTTQQGAGTIEEGGSFLNNTESKHTESTVKYKGQSSSGRSPGSTTPGGWRVRVVKLIDGGKDLTSKSKAQRLDDLNIVGGTHSQKQAGRIEEGGSYLNDALRTQHNETTVMVNGEEKDSASGGWRAKTVNDLPNGPSLAHQQLLGSASSIDAVPNATDVSLKPKEDGSLTNTDTTGTERVSKPSLATADPRAIALGSLITGIEPLKQQTDTALLSRLSMMEELDFSNNQIGTKAGIEIANWLCREGEHVDGNNSTGMKSVFVDSCDLDFDAVHAIINAIGHPNKADYPAAKLENLDISNPRLHKHHNSELIYEHIGRMLAYNTSLKELHLGKMLIKDDTLKILSDALVSNPNNEIAVLDLRCNLIGWKGLQALSVYIQSEACKLTHLNLEANRIGEGCVDST